MHKLERIIRSLERRDTKLTLKMARAQYKRNKKTLIEYNNGCVEFWYTYHFFEKAYKRAIKTYGIKQIHFTEEKLA